VTFCKQELNKYRDSLGRILGDWGEWSFLMPRLRKRKGLWERKWNNPLSGLTRGRGTGSRGTGSRGVENAGSGGKRGVWKMRGLVETRGTIFSPKYEFSSVK